MATRTDTTLESAYGTTPEEARDARARAWVFIFDCYAKKAARTRGGEDGMSGPDNDRATSKGAVARFGPAVLSVDHTRSKSKV